MKRISILSLAVLAVAPLLAAESTPKEAVTGAAAALGNEPNYSWHTTVDMGNGGRFRPGPTDGKTEKGGFTTLTLSFNDATTEVVIQGTNAAVKTPDEGWRSAEEVARDGNGGGPNPARFAVFMARGAKAPAEQAATLAAQAKELTAGTNGIGGELSEEGAKSLLMFRRGGNGDGPTVSNAKGTVTFWLTDGKLMKFQTHVTGTLSFNGNDREVDRTTTTEIKEVGTTKVTVADEARKKLE
jgi:hypothetical protein